MNSFRKHIKKKLSGYEPEVNDLSLHENWQQAEHLWNKKNESKQRLNSFEPEVDDAYMEEKWKAIIPYLPEEKKRRALFYIPTGCLLPGAFLLAPLLLVMLYYFTCVNETITKLPGEDSKQSSAIKHGEKEAQQPQGNTTVIKSSAIVAAGSGMSSSNSNHAAESSKQGEHYEQSPAVPEQGIALSVVPENTTTGYPAIVDSVCLLHPIACFPDRLISDSILKLVVVARDSVPVKKESRLVLDATAGMVSMFNRAQFEGLQEMNSRQTGLGLSAALHYRLNKRLLLSAQLTAIDNRHEYRDESTKNFILVKIPSTSSSSPGSIDSAIRYISFEKIHQLRSVFSCQAGAGMEVGLFTKNKLSLSAGLLVQLSMTQFKHMHSYQPIGDTLTYIKQSSSPPLPNTTKDSEPEMTGSTFFKTNLGVCPGLVIGYRLNNNIDIIIKPAAYFDVKELKPARVSYNQNSFFLTGGIRIKM